MIILTDNLSKDDRRKNMQAIKSISKLEDIVAKELWKNGIRFRRNVSSLKGKPDIAIKKYKVVIFIDSCFWHCCPEHGNIPKTNIEYWTKKLARNKQRDIEINQYYIQQNWHLVRIWEHELKQDFQKTIKKIIMNIIEAKEKTKKAK